ncbi:MAG: zinc ribbon domain-containing protein [Pyrinomonadaceae bacterium]
MYCPTCGAECQPGLNFCNRCGAAVNGALNAKPELVPVDLRSPIRVLGTTICLTTLIGLTILFFGLAGLASWHVDEGVIGGVGIIGLFFLFGVELSLIRLVSRLLVGVPEKRKLSLPFMKQSATKELYAPPQYQPTLPEGRPSVTEHTTRTFSPVYREPRS